MTDKKILSNIIDSYMIVKTGTLNLVWDVDMNIENSAKSLIFTTSWLLDPNVVPNANMEKVVLMWELSDKIFAINEMLWANWIIEMLHFTFALWLDRRNSDSLKFSFTELSKAYRPDYRANEAMKSFIKNNMEVYNTDPSEYFDCFFLIKDIFTKTGEQWIIELTSFVMEYSDLDNDIME